MPRPGASSLPQQAQDVEHDGLFSDDGGPAPINSEDPLKTMLLTPYDKVYSLSADGTTYTRPRILFGAPVAKIQEASAFWELPWTSLEQFLAKEDEEIRLKAAAHLLKRSDPLNKKFAHDSKLHQDNCSKYKKIRQIFGPSTNYHPNQLVAKRHMPLHGLCEMEIMYHVACKISDLQILQRHGELAMDPFDFFRWRVSVEANRRMQLGDNAKDIIRSVVYGLGGPQSEKTGDVLFREAVILAAKHVGRDASYGSKKKNGEKKGSSLPRAAPQGISRGQGSSSLGNSSGSPSAGLRLRQQAQRQRRAERPQVPSTYGGVNSFRAQRQRSASS